MTENKKSSSRRSYRVTEKSDALDLEKGIFTFRDPEKIVRSLKRSAESSTRKKISSIPISHVYAYLLQERVLTMIRKIY